jgi:hypothetical protein
MKALVLALILIVFTGCASMDMRLCVNTGSAIAPPHQRTSGACDVIATEDSVYLQHPDTQKIVECDGKRELQEQCVTRWQERGYVPGDHDTLKSLAPWADK